MIIEIGLDFKTAEMPIKINKKPIVIVCYNPKLSSNTLIDKIPKEIKSWRRTFKKEKMDEWILPSKEFGEY